MTKIEIDNKKMWESILGFQLEGEEAKKFNDLCKDEPFKVILAFFSKAFKKGLKDQGLCYKDGEINTIEPKVEWYMCIKESAGFKAGHIYKCNGGRFVNDLGVMFTAGYWGDYFRPATEEEVMKYSYKDKPNYPLMPSECTTIEPDVKWYVALNDYGHYDNTIFSAVPLFLKGERTTKENVFNMCKDIMGYEITEEEFNKNFRLATEEETTRKTLVEVYQSSVDSATKEPKQPKDELTELELKLQVVMLQVKSGLIDPKDISVVKKWSDIMLVMARKQIASEIDATQMIRDMSIKDLKTLTLGAAYYQGIVNTIKKIKGESV